MKIGLTGFDIGRYLAGLFVPTPLSASDRPGYPTWEDYQAAMKRADTFHVEHKGNESMTKYAEGKRVVPWDELPPMPTFEQAAAERKVAADAQLRDQFAIAALTGIVTRDVDDCMLWESMATYAYRTADAMMKERARVT